MRMGTRGCVISAIGSFWREGPPVGMLNPKGLWWLIAPEGGGGVHPATGGGGGVQPATGGGGSQGTPTYIPQNARHVAMVILRCACWGPNGFAENIHHSKGGFQQLGWGLGGGVRGVKFFLIFCNHF